MCVYRLEVLSSPVKYSESGQEIRRYAAFHTYDRVHISCIVYMYMCTCIAMTLYMCIYMYTEL